MVEFYGHLQEIPSLDDIRANRLPFKVPSWLTCTKCKRRATKFEFGVRRNAKLVHRGYRSCWCFRCQRNSVANNDASNPGRRQRWREENPERDRRINRESAYRRYTAIKLALVEGYGGECECCSESDIHFLTIDHRYGVPDHHRYPSGKRRTGEQLMMMLMEEGFPEYMRLLCWNCNLAYANHGYCPHQEPGRVYRDRITKAEPNTSLVRGVRLAGHG